MIELTKTQAETFFADGFVVFDKLVDPEVIARARERFAPMFRGEFETGIRPDEVNWQEGKSAADRTRQICNGWKGDRAIASIVLREDFGRIVAGLMGWNGTRLMHDNVIWKPPGAKSLGYHQDNAYLSWYRPTGLMTVWIALDDTTAEGGTLEFVRGSHKWQASKPEGEFHAPEDYRKYMIAAARAQGHEPEIVPVVVPMGGGSFHHGWTWHGSGPNRSPNPRRSLVIHAMPADAEFAPEHFGEGNGPIYSRYRRLDDNQMDENHFPILWTKDGRRTKGLERWCKAA